MAVFLDRQMESFNAAIPGIISSLEQTDFQLNQPLKSTSDKITKVTVTYLFIPAGGDKSFECKTTHSIDEKMFAFLPQSDEEIREKVEREIDIRAAMDNPEEGDGMVMDEGKREDGSPMGKMLREAFAGEQVSRCKKRRKEMGSNRGVLQRSLKICLDNVTESLQEQPGGKIEKMSYKVEKSTLGKMTGIAGDFPVSS